MAQHKPAKANQPSEAPTLPFADRAAKLVIAAWAAVAANECRVISQTELCRYLGLSQSAFINWTNRGTELHQIGALLLLLERLPVPARNNLINRFMRTCPSINSNEFTHAPSAASQLRSLLQKQRGVTVIQNGTDFARTFLFTALGNSFKQSRPEIGSVNGLDIHVPDWFTPVPDLSYLSHSEAKQTFKDRTAPLWPEMRRGSWLMLNDVWSLLPERQTEMLRAARDQHVIIADKVTLNPDLLRKLCLGIRSSVHVLEVIETADRQIDVEFHVV